LLLMESVAAWVMMSAKGAGVRGSASDAPSDLRTFVVVMAGAFLNADVFSP